MEDILTYAYRIDKKKVEPVAEGLGDDFRKRCTDAGLTNIEIIGIIVNLVVEQSQILTSELTLVQAAELRELLLDNLTQRLR